MDTPKPPQTSTALLTDLESIRELLEADLVEPPLLTETLEPLDIPLLSEVVSPAPKAPAASPATDARDIPLLNIPVAPPAATPARSSSARPAVPSPTTPPPAATQLSASLRQKLASHGADQLKRVDGELRAAAQLILQDVIDDFVPQIEAELKRRLESRLDQLLPRKP
ncbi:hypothetical protein HNP49_003618 [Pseudomonas fluvialis]|uniref:DNA polymerase III subunit chi n=1 Tax=Pseudomonas fluvialis TaxID=1793966 RepID=A0A7X0EW99_9PSED|nr:DNA polymerase III subunit chi [Pseudomonas fluvialis]MBB6343416.1 hypothetical protein [Pseudomonas fluvialis]